MGMFKTIFLIGVILICLALFLLAGSVPNETTDTGNVPDSENIKAPQTFQLTNSNLEYKDGIYQVEGEVRALTDLDYVEANVKFYNAENKVIYSGLSNMQNLDIGETWDFTVYGPLEDVVSYNLTVKDSIY